MCLKLTSEKLTPDTPPWGSTAGSTVPSGPPSMTVQARDPRSTMNTPIASIILPTLNGSSDLKRLLPRLAEQQLEGGFEVLAVDSSSDDDSVALLRSAGAEVDVIDRRDFSHGGTRTRRAADARGDFLVFLSQDAVPADDAAEPEEDPAPAEETTPAP